MPPWLSHSVLKIGVAGAITAALSVWTDRIDYVWYPLLAVVLVCNDDDEHTLRTAFDRSLGTVLGGVVTFLVHQLLGGWIGVLVAMLLLVPLLHRLGWQSALGTACLVSVMFLMIPAHAALDWGYALNRSLDTAVGCLIAALVGLLFWPRGLQERLKELESSMRSRIEDQLAAHHRWLEGQGARPNPLSPAGCTASTLAMEQLLEAARHGSEVAAIQRHRWRQRLLLWQNLHHHWIQWERMRLQVPQAATATPPDRSAPLPLQMALEEEHHRLMASLRSLHCLWRRDR